jgi:hypothetical protein
MKTKSKAHITLDRLHNNVGVFHTIIPDNAPELIAGDSRKKAIHAGSCIKPVKISSISSGKLSPCSSEGTA